MSKWLNACTLSDEELLGLAPQLFRELAQHVPVKAVMGLAQRYGGLRISVPRTARAATKLSRELGMHVLEALCKVRPGERCAIPRATRWICAARHRDVVTALRAGLSVSRVARKCRLTERAVYRIARLYRTDKSTARKEKGGTP